MMIIITNFINELIATNSEPSIREFTAEVQQRFYPTQDISFMDYFFELAKQENEGKFIVPHAKLIEYGIATSTRSSAINDRLKSLGLIETEDFTLQDVLQRHNNGRGATIKHVYMITPEAFKKTLMRAQKRNDQSIDVIKYANYYLFLEKVVKYYDLYQITLKDLLLKQKDGENVTLRELMKKLEIQNDAMKNQNDELISMSRQQMATMNVMNNKIDVLFDFMLSFARMTIPMWLGSSVIKTQFDNLSKNNDNTYALKHLKIMFVVSFVDFKEREDFLTVVKDKIEYKVRSTMKTYFCCTNFADVCGRIKLLFKRHGNTLYMLQPQVVCLYSGEINTEISNLKNMSIFPDKTFATYVRNCKMFEVSLPSTTFDSASNYYNLMIANARKQRFQAYQTRIDNLIETNNCPVSNTIIDHMTTADNVFFAKALPFCQQFIDCYTTENHDDNGDLIDWAHSSIKKTTKKRPDMKNVVISDKTYSLRSLHHLINANTGEKEIDNMVDSGIISKKDISSLKKLAKLESIDLTEIEFPEDLSDDSE